MSDTATVNTVATDENGETVETVAVVTADSVERKIDGAKRFVGFYVVAESVTGEFLTERTFLNPNMTEVEALLIVGELIADDFGIAFNYILVDSEDGKALNVTDGEIVTQ